VADGRVTLSGQVDFEFQKRRAGLIATQLQGIRAADNYLEIVFKNPRSDREIRKDILNILGRAGLWRTGQEHVRSDGHHGGVD
jgi:osmotically-inducible protein OsmY